MGENEEKCPDEVQQRLNEVMSLNRQLDGEQADVEEDAWIQDFGEKPPNSGCPSPIN